MRSAVTHLALVTVVLLCPSGQHTLGITNVGHKSGAAD